LPWPTEGWPAVRCAADAGPRALPIGPARASCPSALVGKLPGPRLWWAICVGLLATHRIIAAQNAHQTARCAASDVGRGGRRRDSGGPRLAPDAPVSEVQGSAHGLTELLCAGEEAVMADRRGDHVGRVAARDQLSQLVGLFG